MHPTLSIWIGEYFYNNQYYSAVKHPDREDKRIEHIWSKPTIPIRFLHCAYPDQRNARMSSYFNRGEISMISDIVKQLIDYKIHPEKITILTGYFVQTIQLHHFLYYSGTNKKEEIDGLTISTINGYQGRENDYIILSCVRSNKDHNVGFMSNKARINVALSRARYGIIIIGNAYTLQKSPVCENYFNFLREYQNDYRTPLVFGDFSKNLYTHLHVCFGLFCHWNIKFCFFFV